MYQFNLFFFREAKMMLLQKMIKLSLDFIRSLFFPKIVFHLEDKNAVIPFKASKYSAGYDLYCVQDFTIPPESRLLVETGVIMEIPVGYYGRIAPRSGLAFKNGIHVLAGVVDADYRNSVKVILHNLDKENPLVVEKHERIAQIIITKYCYNVVEVVSNELTHTERGKNGFGSSGK